MTHSTFRRPRSTSSRRAPSSTAGRHLENRLQRGASSFAVVYFVVAAFRRSVRVAVCDTSQLLGRRPSDRGVTALLHKERVKVERATGRSTLKRDPPGGEWLREPRILRRRAGSGRHANLTPGPRSCDGRRASAPPPIGGSIERLIVGDPLPVSAVGLDRVDLVVAVGVT